MAEIGASRIPDQGGRGRGESAVLRGGVASLDSQRDCQQGVDLAIVEDDRFAGEFPGAGFSHHLVEITAGGEEGHIALLHRPHDQQFAATAAVMINESWFSGSSESSV